MADKVDNFVTKDQELAERLEKEECVITKVRRDPADGLKEYTFEESKSEINKILGGKFAEEKEVLPEVEKKKAGRPKKKRR